MARMMMHMRVRKVVVVGSHGQRDDHGGDRGGDRGGRADATAKVTASSTEWSLRIKPVYIKYNIHTERMRSVAA